MEAIRILMDEHRLIEEGLAVGDAMAAALLRGEDVPRPDVEALLRFLGEFADGAHHRKEEEGLFRWMQEQGFPANTGPLGCMMAEHEEGRRLRAVARQALDEGPGGIATLAGALRTFGSHLRMHIQKEDQVLYPMALQLGDGDAELLPHYREVCPAQDEIMDENRARIAELARRPWATAAARGSAG